MLRLWALGLLALLALLLAACGSSNGLPSKDGSYPIQGNSLTWDGQQYRFSWADANGGLHQAHGSDFKLVQDQQTFLQMQNHHGTIHLQPSAPITVLAQDRNGNFTNSWFPFLAGAALGSTLGSSRTPTYYYPPTDQFGRGDELAGSVTTTVPKPPDYSTIKPPPDAVRPAAGAVAGQSAGAGGGNAATNKLGNTSSGGAGVAQPAAVAGQSGGTGSGSAASSKGGFRAGSSSYASHASSSGAASSKSSSSSSHSSSSRTKSSSSSSSHTSTVHHSAPSHSSSHSVGHSSHR